VSENKIKMRQYIFTFFISLLLFSSCKNKNEKPDFISEDKFINMLIDIHITDANMSENNIYRSGNNYRPSYYYNSIYSKYNIDNKQFDSIIGYYTSNLKQLEFIYEQVIDSLNKLETKLKIDLAQQKQILDTVNLWDRKILPVKILTKDSLNKDTLSYIIPINNIKGLYTIKAKYKLFNDDSSENTYLNAFFVKYDKDSLEHRIKFDSIFYLRDTSFTDIKLQLELSDSTYSSIKINFYNTISKKGEYSRHFDIKDVLIYNPKIKDTLSTKLNLLKLDTEKLILPKQVNKNLDYIHNNHTLE